MQHRRLELGLELEAAVARERALRARIWTALYEADRYPWALFARVHAPKTASDLVEALIGAIWIDSSTSSSSTPSSYQSSYQSSSPSSPGGAEAAATAAVDAFLHRLGLLPLLDRFLRDDVDVVHPKEELWTRWATRPGMTPTYKPGERALPRVAALVEVDEVAGEGGDGDGYDAVVDWDGLAADGRTLAEMVEVGGLGPEDVGARAASVRQPEREFECTMNVGPKLVAHVRGCVNSEEAVVKAAEVAVAKFRAAAAAAKADGG